MDLCRALAAGEAPPPEYTRVVLRGRFDHGATMLVGPRPRSAMGQTQQGYFAVTPLHSTAAAAPKGGGFWPSSKGSKGSDSGGGGGGSCVVLVNRGWVPGAWKDDAAARAAGQPAGEVEVEGVVRAAEEPSSFVPRNDAPGGAWFYLAPAEMAAAARLPPGAPLVEVVAAGDGEAPPGGPPTAMDVLGGRARSLPRAAAEFPAPKADGDLLRFSVMPRDHLNYALTWGTLAAASLGLAAKAVRQQRRGGGRLR